MFPHYRSSVVQELQKSKINEYTFIGATDAHEGIKPIPLAVFNDFRVAKYSLFGPFYWQPLIIKYALSSEFDGIIFLGNPNFLSTWIASFLARVSGKKVLFWTHGWLKKEGYLKSKIRNLFFRIAHRTMVYNERACALGSESGFPIDRIDVIYNSLDFDKALSIVFDIENGFLKSHKPQNLFSDSSLPVLVCSARLTKLCQFDLLIKAADILNKRNESVNVLLIGDGPEKTTLKNLSESLSVNTHFFGACYDESILGQLIYHSDLTVSPGKIGLTAMHSLMYGTPAITHSDLDYQMPEVEAIENGVSGLFFKRNDVSDLAEKISILMNTVDRKSVRVACKKIIENKWNSRRQVINIEDSIGKIF